MKELRTEVYVEQVVDGKNYKGHIHFGNLYNFNYELNCEQNIEELDKLAVNDVEEAKRKMHIIVRNSEYKEVSISEELSPLFQALIIPFAYEFYQNPLTRGLNSSESKSLDRMLESFGGSRSMGATQSHIFDGDYLEPLLVKCFTK